ncbi:hypothetical protein ACGFSB_20180 [Streptomyces sp. NPDC048441]
MLLTGCGGSDAWMMLPLALLVPGPLALALTAIDVRNVRVPQGKTA